MELSLGYRALRKISDWTLEGFYSDVYIEGFENVPKEGPLIIASSHHNEIIDIATLAVTIPHRRQLSFWAKSTLFTNPIVRSILLSARSIPVRRNPNSNSPRQQSTPSTSQATLFKETSAALAAGEAIGVFPEGTSYTEPCIAQVKEGAAWAAVEFVKSEKRKQDEQGIPGKSLVIVPVGIVYTDKSQYQSRVCVNYGSPLAVESYFSSPGASSREVVQKITSEIERQMIALTINSPDWDTLFAARIARDILSHGEQKVDLRDFIQYSQSLVDDFSSERSLESGPSAKTSLIRYYALLHYTGMTHSSLAAVYPIAVSRSNTPSERTSLLKTRSANPSRSFAFFTLVNELITTLFHPRALLFVPPFLVNFPGYITGLLAVKLLATPDEEEGPAQFKAVFGGLGMGLSYVGAQWGLIKWLIRFGEGSLNLDGWPRIFARVIDEGKTFGVLDALKWLGVVLSGSEGGWLGKVKRAAATASVVYGTGWAVFRWHNSLVGQNYRQFKRLAVSYKIFAGLLFSRRYDLPLDQLTQYMRPPIPPANPFIKRRITGRSPPAEIHNNLGESSNREPSTSRLEVPYVASRRLIRHLLSARVEATELLEKYMGPE